ncbi:MAG: histidine triad nucleotide-binding protein [Deltaproteobacteria bacterium]|nr:histidine triad nucleotide-binding protein [Deltaproteobacteria bacterium]
MTSCLFCRIAAGTLPARIVHEDDRSVAFADINPKAPVHVLVIPRDHVATLNEPADEALLGHLIAVAVRVARDAGVDGSGYRLVVNTNGDAGQSVFHVHVHVLGGRPFGWPPG